MKLNIDKKKLPLHNNTNEPNAETDGNSSNLSSSLSVNSPLCQRNCMTCTSPYIQEIHEMRLEQRLDFRTISKKLAEKYQVKISYVAISKHFRKYNEYIRNMTNQAILEYTNSEVDFRSAHVSQLNDLINSMFVKIAASWGSITPSIESLSHLVKLRYQVMEGQIDPESFDAQVKILIQNAEKINNVSGQTKFGFMKPEPAVTREQHEKSASETSESALSEE